MVGYIYIYIYCQKYTVNLWTNGEVCFCLIITFSWANRVNLGAGVSDVRRIVDWRAVFWKLVWVSSKLTYCTTRSTYFEKYNLLLLKKYVLNTMIGCSMNVICKYYRCLVVIVMWHVCIASLLLFFCTFYCYLYCLYQKITMFAFVIVKTTNNKHYSSQLKTRVWIVSGKFFK